MKVIWDFSTQYGMAGDKFMMADILHYESKSYQINAYLIEVE